LHAASAIEHHPAAEVARPDSITAIGLDGTTRVEK